MALDQSALLEVLDALKAADVDDRIRSASRADLRTALYLLVAGPTRTEVAHGLRTALPPEPLDPEVRPRGSRVVTIDVGRELTDVSGANQLPAVAQVVWTATQLPDVTLVRLTADGEDIELPTDHGLTDQPVSRRDYLSVAPAQESTASPDAPPPGTPGTDRPTEEPADSLSGVHPRSPWPFVRHGESVPRAAFWDSAPATVRCIWTIASASNRRPYERPPLRRDAQVRPVERLPC